MDDQRPRRGLGFFPEVAVIRDRVVPQPDSRTWHDTDEFNAAGPSRPRPLLQGKDTWELWKDWNTNQSGHAGRKGPPVFVPASRQYDDLGRGMADGFDVDVEEEKQKKRPTGEVAEWYRTLASAKPMTSMPPEPPDRALSDNTPSRPHSSPAAGTTTQPTSLAATPAPVPIRVHQSEWFIRRALANTSSSAPTTRATTPSSIGSMLSLTPTARPPPRPRYAIGPENAGYTRLAALGWGGGGLGKPEETQVDATAKRPRAKSLEAGPVVHADGVVDLTVDTSDSEDEAEPIQGPGRVAPVSTALKLDRLGLGRRHAEKKVTHTQAEILAAQRRRRGGTDQKKIDWKKRDKRERESRQRIAALLNA